MGSLRLLLAFAVVLVHSAPLYGFTGIGSQAVPAFFVISGFYMSLALTTSYDRPGGLWLFYSNRFLRIFPLYWATLLLFVLISLVGYTGVEIYDRLPFLASNAIERATDGTWASLAALVPNLFVVGADIFRLFVVDTSDGNLVAQTQSMTLGGRYREGYVYLVLPQNWSLAVEILCYAAAPFFARLRTWMLAGWFLAFVAIQEWSAGLDLHWLHLPFWFNFSYFLLGMLAYRATQTLLNLPKSIIVILSACPFAVWAFYPDTHGLPPEIKWPVWLLYAAAIPALFSLTKHLEWDRNLGALSYPVYLIHWLFAWPAVGFGPAQPIVAMLASCLTAWLFVKSIDEPIAEKKQRRMLPVHQ